jgi:hypothetical protein
MVLFRGFETVKRFLKYSIIIFILEFLLLISIFVYAAFSQSRYEVKCSQILINRSYQYLINEVGKIEGKENRGIADVYNSAIGNPLGSSYCQAGQYWCYYKSCQDYNLNYSLIPMPRNGMAYSTYQFGVHYGKMTIYKPKIHDFIVWKAKTNGTGHIERIVKIGKAGWVTTIGFNTGSASQDNGEGVFYKKRNIYFPLNRIKYIKGLVGVKGI